MSGLEFGHSAVRREVPNAGVDSHLRIVSAASGAPKGGRAKGGESGGQVHVERTKTDKPEVDETAPEGQKAVDKDAMDALLDDIDESLEENAEEFVRNYVQKGGQ